MKRILTLTIISLFCITLFAQNENPIKKNTKLLVYYFHITNRCHTCISIEAATKKVLENTYKAKLEDGTIVFKTFNVDLPENKEIIKKYQAYGATLALTKIENEKETNIDDITGMAFSKINNEEIYINELKSKIDQLIK